MTKLSLGYQEEIIGVSDDRISKITEMLTNIKFLKLYSWENIFKERATNVRESVTNKTLKILSVPGIDFIKKNCLFTCIVFIFMDNISCYCFSINFYSFHSFWRNSHSFISIHSIYFSQPLVNFPRFSLSITVFENLLESFSNV